MASCRNDTAADARDQAILAVLFGAGLRREEIAILELENFKQEESLLQFIGKGNKERRVPLPTGTDLAQQQRTLC
jgi:site-specific recombinase XerD